jgi:hypothetical protein
LYSRAAAFTEGCCGELAANCMARICPEPALQINCITRLGCIQQQVKGTSLRSPVHSYDSYVYTLDRTRDV